MIRGKSEDIFWVAQSVQASEKVCVTLQLFLLCFDDCGDVEMAKPQGETRTRRKARRKKRELFQTEEGFVRRLAHQASFVQHLESGLLKGVKAEIRIAWWPAESGSLWEPFKTT
ncbi:uncharacterized protein LOC144305722 [Canis aureus]